MWKSSRSGCIKYCLDGFENISDLLLTLFCCPINEILLEQIDATKSNQRVHKNFRKTL